MIQAARIVVGFIAAVVLVLAAAAAWQRNQDRPLLIDRDLVSEAEALAAEGRWHEAALLAGYAAGRPDLGDPARARALAAQARETLGSTRYRTISFARGALTGEPTDTASFLGSLSLDLFLIGDLRDLAVQGYREARYDDGDPVILALAGVGLATSAAPWADWAPAVLKAFRRAGALTARFSRALARSARAALRTGNTKPLRGIVTDFGTSARKLGIAPTAGVMRHVDTPAELSRVAGAATVDAPATYAVARTSGRAGLARLAPDGRNVRRVAASLRLGSRGFKISWKGFQVLPLPVLGTIAVLAAVVLALALGMTPARFLRRRRAASRCAVS